MGLRQDTREKGPSTYRKPGTIPATPACCYFRSQAAGVRSRCWGQSAQHPRPPFTLEHGGTRHGWMVDQPPGGRLSSHISCLRESWSDQETDPNSSVESTETMMTITFLGDMALICV